MRVNPPRFVRSIQRGGGGGVDEKHRYAVRKQVLFRTQISKYKKSCICQQIQKSTNVCKNEFACACDRLYFYGSSNVKNVSFLNGMQYAMLK